MRALAVIGMAAAAVFETWFVYCLGFNDGQINVRRHLWLDVGYHEEFRDPYIACLYSSNDNGLAVCAREHKEAR